MTPAPPHGWWARARGRAEGRIPMPITHFAPFSHHEPAAVVRRRRRVVAGVSVLAR